MLWGVLPAAPKVERNCTRRRDSTLPNPIARKLQRRTSLSETDRNRLLGLIQHKRFVPAREDVIREGDMSDRVHVVLDGLACRYRLLPGGGRQICAYLVPGDFCDLDAAILGRSDYSVATLSPCTLAEIPRAEIDEITDTHPRLARALWSETLVDGGILREWLVSMGRRTADRHMAHLFCELLVRLEAVGLARDDAFDLPITQEELGDALGLSVVHVNRVLQGLREDGLLAFRRRTLSILDRPRLMAFAGFNGAYLHLGEPRQIAIPAEARPSVWQ